MTKHDCEGPSRKRAKTECPHATVGTATSLAALWGFPHLPLCARLDSGPWLLRARQWNVDMKDRIPLGAQASIGLWSTHLQVKELAVPPVDSLGGGVGPGHVDNIYLQEKGECVSG